MIRRAPRSTLSLHDALPIWEPLWPVQQQHRRYSNRPGDLLRRREIPQRFQPRGLSLSTLILTRRRRMDQRWTKRSEEHTSELQSQSNLVCSLLLDKKKQKAY